MAHFVVLCNMCYAAVDVWSVGCIMAELLTGRPLFPGNDRMLALLLINYLHALHHNDLLFSFSKGAHNKIINRI